MIKGRYKKGQPPGPGRPKNSREMNLLRMMTKQEFSILIHKFFNMPFYELEQFVKDKSKPTLELLVAAFCADSYEEGDPSKIESLIHRTFGKVPDKIEVSETDWINELNDEELDKLYDDLKQKEK